MSFAASSSALLFAKDGGADPTLAQAAATANNLRRDKPLTPLSLAILISSQLAESRTEQSGGRFARVTYQFGGRHVNVLFTLKSNSSGEGGEIG